MTKTFLKPRLFYNKLKQKLKPQMENIQSQLPPNLQFFLQKLLSGDGFVKNK